MATAVYINRNTRLGRRVMEALDQIRQGIGVLQELDGMRAESIGAGQSVMASNFGVQDNTQAQAINDRWGALIAAYDDGGNAEFSKVRDILNATFDENV